MPRMKPLGGYELLTICVLTAIAGAAFIALTYAVAYLLWGC